MGLPSVEEYWRSFLGPLEGLIRGRVAVVRPRGALVQGGTPYVLASWLDPRQSRKKASLGLTTSAGESCPNGASFGRPITRESERYVAGDRVHR
jgi:hypothetical protein